MSAVELQPGPVTVKGWYVALLPRCTVNALNTESPSFIEAVAPCDTVPEMLMTQGDIV